MNTPLSTAVDVSNKIYVAFLSFQLYIYVVITFMISSLTHGLFKNIFINFQTMIGGTGD